MDCSTGSLQGDKNTMYGLIMDYQLTLRPMMERAYRLFGSKEVVTRVEDGLHRYTYSDFYERCGRLANGLTRLGIKPGDRVGTFAWNSYRHLELYFGVPCFGAITHTLNVRLPEDQLAYIITHADDRVIFVEPDLLPLLESIADSLPAVRNFVVLHQADDGEPVSSLPNVVSYEELLSGEPPDFSWPDLDERQAAAMCYTSGTTGKPKGVLYSHRAIYMHTLTSVSTAGFGIEETDTVMPLVPMFHVLSWGIPYAATWLGCKQVYTGPFMQSRDIAELIQGEKVTYTAGVPTIWIGLLNFLQTAEYNVSSLRRIPVGGAAAPPSLIENYAKQLGVELVHAWGMTEMSPIGTLSYLKSYMREWPEDVQSIVRGKQGLSSLNVELRAVSENGGEVPWDGSSPGELQVRGTSIISEYYRDESSDESFMEGWFRTGDVVTIDPEGYIQIVDRTKDLVKSGGEWISTVALENALMAHDDVLEAVVVAVPHPKWQERPLALVVPNPNSESHPDKQTLYSMLGGSFQKWQLPEDILFVEEIPKTSVGKFDKKVIREQYRDFRFTG